MILTEQEARKRWCPMVRELASFLDTGGVASTNDRGRGEGASCRCIASGCMMWRWLVFLDQEAATDPGNPVLMVQSDRGYCGLAGHPDVPMRKGGAVVLP